MTPTPIVEIRSMQTLQAATLQAVFKEVDQQFENVVSANIAFNTPNECKKTQRQTLN